MQAVDRKFAEMFGDAQTPEGRRYAQARGQAYRLLAQAHAAQARAELLNPWAPEMVRRGAFETFKKEANRYVECAERAEAEAVEGLPEVES